MFFQETTREGNLGNLGYKLKPEDSETLALTNDNRLAKFQDRSCAAAAQSEAHGLQQDLG